MLLSKCRDVRITGITLANSPSFHLVPEDCEDVLIEKVTIAAPDEGVNTDGIDPSRSRRVRISKCRIDVGDDNIAIKAGKAVPGREFACEDIMVSDCVFLRGHGVSIGSETIGGVGNVRVERCSFNGTENGIRIKSPRGKGGRVEDIIYSDIIMTNVNPAIVLTCYYPKIPARDKAQPRASDTPAFRNLVVSNLVAFSTGEAGIIVGLPESPVSGIRLSNVRIQAGGQGLTIRNATGVTLDNVKIEAKTWPGIITENADVQNRSK